MNAPDEVADEVKSDKEIEELSEKYGIRPKFIEALERYRVGHIRPGSFLTSFLAGSLVKSFRRADEQALENMDGLFSYCWNELPAHCWRSPKHVKNWLEKRNVSE